MGCCSSQGRNISEKILIAKFIRSIENKSFKSFSILYDTLSHTKKDINIINTKICEMHGVSLNCLGYAL